MEKSSEEYKKLCKEIIDSLLGQICTSNLNYCVKGTAGRDSAKRLIYQKFEEYESKALEKMQGDILDRHKVSSCMCGAIVEVQPLVGYRNAIILKNANELFALYWSKKECGVKQGICYTYDIWAYAKIFYHLELYNKPLMRQCYENYRTQDS